MYISGLGGVMYGAQSGEGENAQQVVKVSLIAKFSEKPQNLKRESA